MTDLPVIGLLRDQAQSPLDRWRCSSWGQEELIRHAAAGVETYAHAGNGGGKTEGGIAFDLAVLQGRESLRARDGTTLPIPRVPPPVSWGLGVISYKVAGGSSLQALRRLLGTWPHHEVRAGGPDGVSTLYVRHTSNHSDDPATWSRLYILPYDGPIPEGLRLDGWHCDEPPPAIWLDALRTRFKRGRKLYGLITSTPIDRQTWYPIRSQFPDELLRVVNNRVRVQWSTEDNEALDPGQVKSLKAQFAGTPWERARLYGDHIDATGSNPWPWELLEKWARRCREPVIERLEVQREVDGVEGRRLAPIACDLEVWDEPEENEVYALWCDVGKGVADGKHDPDCIHVYARRRRKLVARVNAYLGGYGLGQACAIVARRYNQALITPLVTGGYGESILTGLRLAGYHKIGVQRTERAPGKWDTRLGVTETAALRAKAIEGIEAALQSDSILVESAAVVQCLKDCVVDANGKVLAGPGYHDEDMVLLGMAALEVGTRNAPSLPVERVPSPKELLEREARGLPARPLVPRPPVVRDRW